MSVVALVIMGLAVIGLIGCVHRKPGGTESGAYEFPNQSAHAAKYSANRISSQAHTSPRASQSERPIAVTMT